MQFAIYYKGVLGLKWIIESGTLCAGVGYLVLLKHLKRLFYTCSARQAHRLIKLWLLKEQFRTQTVSIYLAAPTV